MVRGSGSATDTMKLGRNLMSGRFHTAKVSRRGTQTTVIERGVRKDKSSFPPTQSLESGEGLVEPIVLDAFSDSDIAKAAASDPDNPLTDEAFWADAELVVPPKKTAISLRVDEDVLDFFKAEGRGYQTRMNAVLRQYMDANKKSED